MMKDASFGFACQKFGPLLPVASAVIYRTFSKLSLINSKLRTTMSQKQLEALMFCGTEIDIVKAPTIEFAAGADSRLNLG